MRLGLIVGLHRHIRLIVAALVTALVAVLTITLAIKILPVVVAIIALVLALIGPLAILLVIGLATLLLEPRIQNTIIVIGMLEVVFRQDTIPGRARIARHGQEFLHQLLRIAAHPAVVTTVKVWIAATTATATASTTAARTRFAAVTTALTALHIIVLLIHQNEWTF